MTSTRSRVLFVCTANECRSPFAEALARRAADGLPIEFASAGIDSWSRPVPRVGLTHARELGLDLASHVSRSIHPDVLDDYDAILALSRSHAREVLAVAPEVASRTFTLKQFARWLERHPRPPRARLGPWLDAVAADRSATDFIGSEPADDVDDPINQPIGRWRKMSADLIPAVELMIDGLFPQEPAGRVSRPRRA